MEAHRQPGKPPTKAGGDVQTNSNTPPFKIPEMPSAIGIAVTCGLAETAGHHLIDAVAMLALNPWPASAIGGAAIATAVTSRRGRTAIASALHWMASKLEEAL